MAAYMDIRRPHQEERTPLDDLPVTVTRRIELFRAHLICSIATLFSGIAIFVLVADPDTVNGHPAWGIVFLFLGVGLFLYGLREARWRKTISISKDRVAVIERGLFGMTSWEEPLSNYKGVMARSKDVSRRGKIGHNIYTVYLVDLCHPDDARTVTLFASKSDEDWQSSAEDAAARLGLRML